MADGGEGTLQALVASTHGQFIKTGAIDPIGRAITGQYGVLGDGKTIIIEMAEVSGLLLLKKAERNPLNTTTYGTGLLIRHALDLGYRNFIIGVGGSATNDGGAGMAQALGVKFFRKDKTEISEKLCGKLLGDVAAIDVSELHAVIGQSQIVVACDVRNPLLGEHGCAKMYSPQKGAIPAMVKQLEKNMTMFMNVAEKSTGLSVQDIPGAGAAGGLAAGLKLFLGAEFQSGVDIVLNACGFSEKIKNADMILTGEGKIDSQTAFGKTIAGIALRAKPLNIPVIAFAGILENAGDLADIGVTRCYSIQTEHIAVEQSMKNAAVLLHHKVEHVIRNYTTS
jgi:glycerate kinase